MNDSDSEYEETEYLVYADFKNNLPPQQLKHEDAAIKFVGIESDHPVAEINGIIYRGSYEQAMGTNVFFQKEQSHIASDPLYETVSRSTYKYVDKSDKVIIFDRVYIESQPQEAVSEARSIKVEENTETVPPEANHLKLNLTYKEAIRRFGEDQ